MAQFSKTVNYTATTSDATVTGLGATATATRYIRGVHVANVATSAATWNFGVGANLTAGANADAFGESLAANSHTVIYFAGKGKRVDNTAIRAFASAVTVNFTIVYDEVDIT